MKKFTSIKALYACLGILTLFSLSLFSCENSGNGSKLTTISIWYIPSQSEAGEPPADWFLYDKIKKELGIDLKLKALPTDTNELDSIIMQAAKTNSLPDIFRTSRTVMVELAKQNKITNVDRMFPLMPERTRVLYTDAAKKAGQIDGLTFSLSYPTSNTNIPKNEGVLIRKDWLDKLGMHTPETVEEFSEMLRRFTEDDPDGNGIKDTYGMIVTDYLDGPLENLAVWCGAPNGWGEADNGSLEPSFITDEYMDALTLMRDWYSKGYINKDLDTYSSNTFATRASYTCDVSFLMSMSFTTAGRL